MIKITITADTNDGDYIERTTNITIDELEAIKPIIEAIRNFKPYQGKREDWKHLHDHNFPFGEYLPREDLGEKSVEELYGHLPELDLFKELVPFREYGIHSIKSIKIMEVIKEETLFQYKHGS